MRWRRLRKWAKWTCTLAAGAAVTLAVGSGFYKWSYARMSNSADSWRSITVGSGQVVACRVSGLRNQSYSPPTGLSVWWSPRWDWRWGADPSATLSPPPWHAGVFYARSPLAWLAGVSLLYPVALTLIPAALLWYADRRRLRPGLCGGCGYDRAGLLAAVKCPECGSEVIA